MHIEINALTDILQKIEIAFERIINCHFIREDHIDKLTKRAKTTGLAAHIYRVLSAETGESWYIKIEDPKGKVLRQETIGSSTGYVDRLGSRLYVKAEWRGDTFVIIERFGKEVFSLSVSS